MKLFKTLLKLIAPVCMVAALGITPGNGIFTGSSSNPIVLNSVGFAACYGRFNGTTGAIDAASSLDGPAATTIGTNTTQITISTLAGVAQNQPFTPTAGITYQFSPLAGYIIVYPDSTYSGNSNGKITCSNGAGGASTGGGSSTVTVSNAIPTFNWIGTTPNVGGTAPSTIAPVAALTHCTVGSPVVTPSSTPGPGAIGAAPCDPNFVPYQRALAFDPCLDPAVPKLFFYSPFASATTVAMVAASAGNYVHVCSLKITAAAADVFTSEYSTVGSCASGNTTISTYQMTAGMVINHGADIYPGKIPISNGWCLASSTSGPATAEATYVQTSY